MKTINIFISHSWKYSNHYDKLQEWIIGTNNVSGTLMKCFDLSVPQDDPIHDAENDQELRIAIFKKIKESDIVVIPTGMYVEHSKWIKKEIEGAKKFKKPILAVHPQGQERNASSVEENAAAIVYWSQESIREKILNLYQKDMQTV